MACWGRKEIEMQSRLIIKYFSSKSYFCKHFYHYHTQFALILGWAFWDSNSGLPCKARKFNNCSIMEKIDVWEVAITTWQGCLCGLISGTLNWAWCHVLKWVNILGVLKKRYKYELYGLSSCLYVSASRSVYNLLSSFVHQTEIFFYEVELKCCFWKSTFIAQRIW